MSFQGQMSAMGRPTSTNADQPDLFQFLVGMDHNYQEIFPEDVQQSQPVDPALVDQQPQLQVATDYSSDANFLATNQAYQTQDLFDLPLLFDLNRTVDIPLSLEPDYVPRNIIESYTPGDRTTSALAPFGNWPGPTPSVHQVQFAQQQPIGDPSEAPPQPLQRAPTWAQVASFQFPTSHPKFSMRREPVAPTASMLSRPSDVRSMISTSTRTGKRKRSPVPSLSSEAVVSCDHPGCDKKFKDNSALNHHRKNHTKAEDRPYKCKVKGCELAFLWKKDLVRHEIMHSKKKPYVCQAVVNGSRCEKAFSRHDNLRRHHNSAHPNLPCPSTNGSSQP